MSIILTDKPLFQPEPIVPPKYIKHFERRKMDHTGHLRACCRALADDLQSACRGLPDNWQHIVRRCFLHDIRRARQILRRSAH